MSDVDPYENQTTSCHAITCLDTVNGLFEPSSHQDYPLVTTTDHDHFVFTTVMSPMSDVGPHGNQTTSCHAGVSTVTCLFEPSSQVKSSQVN